MGGPSRKDKTNQQFGDWYVQGYVGEGKWECVCKCGTVKVIAGSELTRKKRPTRSCKECSRERKGPTTHGLSKHPYYQHWYAMRGRVLHPSNVAYKYYGERGITICDEWINCPKTFIEYVENVLGEKPSPSHTIDRIDNDKNYEPGNIRWASRKEQLVNRR